MLKGNRSIIAPLGMALIFFSLAAIPAYLSPLGGNISFDPKVVAVADAWREIAEGFVSDYRPINAAEWSHLNTTEAPDAACDSATENSYIARLDSARLDSLKDSEAGFEPSHNESQADAAEPSRPQPDCAKSAARRAIASRRGATPAARQEAATVAALDLRAVEPVVIMKRVSFKGEATAFDQVEVWKRAHSELKRYGTEMSKAAKGAEKLSAFRFLFAQTPRVSECEVRKAMASQKPEQITWKLRQIPVPDPPAVPAQTSEL